MLRDVGGDSDQWEHVAVAVLTRRLELGMTQEELGASAAAHGAGSKTIVSLLERNRQSTYRRAGLIAVARALRWTDDAFDRLLVGASAAELARAPDARDVIRRNTPGLGEVEQLRREVAELRDEIREGFAALRRRHVDDEEE